MGGHLAVAMEDVDGVAPPLRLNPLPNQAEGHGVAVRRQADQIVCGHHARHPRLVLEAGLPGAGDQLSAFPTWKEPERVLRLARLGVAARPGYAPPVDDSERIELFELEPHDVASSAIRERVARGEPIDGLVVPAVASYIAEQRLYAGD